VPGTFNYVIDQLKDGAMYLSAPKNGNHRPRVHKTEDAGLTGHAKMNIPVQFRSDRNAKKGAVMMRSLMLAPILAIALVSGARADDKAIALEYARRHQFPRELPPA